jgi:hypothetical protein
VVTPTAASITGSEESTSARSGLDARKARRLLANTSAPIRYLDVVTSVTKASLPPPPCDPAAPGAAAPVCLGRRSVASPEASTFTLGRLGGSAGAAPRWLPACPFRAPTSPPLSAGACSSSRTAGRAGAGRCGGGVARGLAPRVGLQERNKTCQDIPHAGGSTCGESAPRRSDLVNCDGESCGHNTRSRPTSATTAVFMNTSTSSRKICECWLFEHK